MLISETQDGSAPNIIREHRGLQKTQEVVDETVDEQGNESEESEEDDSNTK